MNFNDSMLVPDADTTLMSTQISVIMNVMKLDLLAGSVSLNFRFMPSGKLSSANSALNLTEMGGGDTNLTILVGDFFSKTFASGSIMGSETVVVPILNLGDINDYPFDVHSTAFPIMSFYGNTEDPARLVQQGYSFEGRTPSYLLESSFILKNDTGTPLRNRFRITIKVTRSATTIGLSIFTVLVIWALGMVSPLVVFDTLLYKREISKLLLSMFTGQMFALPKVRTLAPGIPAMGTTIDMIGFFWVMSLLSACAFAIWIRYIIAT